MPITILTKQAGDFVLPVLGLGTWAMGGRYARNPFNNDGRDIAAIKAAVEMGVTHIDTAEIYAGGHAEELVGEAIAEFDRQMLFLTTKVWWTNLKYEDVIQAAHGSRKRLGIDQIDLYLIHGPNPEIPLTETMRAMDYLLENEMIRYIGVSNFDVSQLAEAMSATKYQIVNNQIHYNLIAREYEANGTLAYCARNKILVTAYRPLGFGPGMSGGIAGLARESLETLGQKYQKTAAQVALNWLLRQPNLVTIFKASNPDHIKENLGALGWQLREDDFKVLTHDFPHGLTKNVGVHPVIH